MSGQYSSPLAVSAWSRLALSSVMLRPSVFERTWLISLWPLVVIVPSGKVTRTSGTCAPARGGSMKAARKSKRVGHFLGFLAVAVFPSELSRKA